MNGTDVLILASGKSERMGIPKANLMCRDNKTTFLEIIIETYQKINSNKIIITLNNFDVENINLTNIKNIEKTDIVVIENPNFGRLNSIIEGLKYTISKQVFIQNIDNICNDFNLLQEMESKLTDNSYVVPVFQSSGGHPIIISKQIVLKILNSNKSQNLKNILKNFKKINLETNNKNILLNINTPDDYMNYLMDL